MVDQATRKAWARGIVERRCRGNAAAFGRKIGKDASYVSRMLATDTRQRRGISDSMISRILVEFPGEQPPPGWRELPPTVNYAAPQEDVLHLRRMVAALALALLTKPNVPDAADAFRDNFHLAATVPGKLELLEGLLSTALRHMPEIQDGATPEHRAIARPARPKSAK